MAKCNSLIGLKWTFTDVNDFCKESKTKHESKGFKYYNEKYIHDVKVTEVDQEGSGLRCYHVMARCHHSYKKNESAHSLECDIVMSDTTSSACSCYCTCVIGQSGACGHVIGLLFQLAQYTTLHLKTVPDVVSSTSLLQQWHRPRGAKIEAAKTEDVVLASTSQQSAKSRPIKSTLYNPIQHCMDVCPSSGSLMTLMHTVSPGSQWLTIQNTAEVVQSKFGTVPRGSVLAYQQQSETAYMLSFPDIQFPDLPVSNCMNDLPQQVTDEQSARIAALQVTRDQSIQFEIDTRLQSDSNKWHQLRDNRITASKIGSVCKRRRDFDKLVQQLRRKVRSTKAMKEGLLREPEAAAFYVTAKNGEVNVYPSGVVVSPFTPWLAATPDRKVYCPHRQPSFGLLEIKCPQHQQISDIQWLESDDGEVKLKRQHDYYYQIQCQLAVTGLEWCDLLVYLSNGLHHLETIYFDQCFWSSVQSKVDEFFLTYFK